MLRRMVASDPAAQDVAGGEVAGRALRGGALFAVPRLLVGLAAKLGPEGESSRSPTSPLDPKALLLRSPRSPRPWGGEPVGLGLVDALAGDDANNCLLLSPRVRLRSYASLPLGCGGHSHPELGKTMSCPAADTAAPTAGMSVPTSGAFFHGDLKSGPEATTRFGGAHPNAKRHSFDLGSKIPGPGSLPASITGAACRFIGSVSASEIEQSEDYTRIIARGPNPKTTHIFGDCILEPHMVVHGAAVADAAMEVTADAAADSYWVVKCDADEDDFLSSCFTCKKELEGNDIYMYRGEKAFCSAECRDQEIMIEEEAENNTSTSSPRSSCSSFHEDIFMAGMVVAT